ncbi:hypothetical protein [Rubripirellula reticaptiva]|uniref:Uncharacterized protein n=1 Tax=Rubripirellula reticaptiva TaxID=2528013 RepID=A0A5C6FBW2_9BACT|nr:hypothetical protein [Rubripirellula reticaptiva]TWU58070.1 hypothetical protein Poly59_09790 [Rubripirellula reticaptiva]
MFGLWSLTYGGMMIDSTSPGLGKVGVRDILAAIRRNCNAMMDGDGWTPLYHAASYRKLVTRVRATLLRQIPT